jgi:hypothetical protein
MESRLQDLEQRLAAATGADRELDAELARELGVEPPLTVDLTASVDRCVEVIHRVLPGWSWHVGWDATGVLPYATLHGAKRLVEARGPTVPLALLRALVKALAPE